jgi:DNA-binding MarR family transcriptional regulator
MTVLQSLEEHDKDALTTLSAAVLPFRQLNVEAPMPLSLLLTFITVARYGRITVNDLAKTIGINQSAVSRQLADLSSKNRVGGVGYNLIEQRIEGIYTMNSLTPKGREMARKMAGEMRRGSWPGRAAI